MSSTDCVAIVGAGITGLSVAWELHRAAVPVRLYEAAGRAGGVMRSELTDDGFLLEWGPNTVLGTPAVRRLAELSGTVDELVEARDSANRRFVVHQGALHAVPTSPRALMSSRLLSGRGKLRLLSERFRRRGPVAAGSGPEESVRDFGLRRLGREATERLLEPFVAGIYAGDAARISYRHGLARAHDLEQRHGSLIRGLTRGASSAGPGRRPTLVGGRRGMQGWAERMAEELARQARGSVRPGCRVTAVEPSVAGLVVTTADGTSEAFRAAILALPHAAVAELLPPAARATFLAGGSPEHASVAIQQWMFQAPPPATFPEGFGALFTRAAASPILGVLTPSHVFADRAPEGGELWTLFAGGALAPERLEGSTVERTREARNYLQELLGGEIEPDQVAERIVRAGICQVGLDHGAVLAAAAATEAANPGLHLAGPWRGGVGVPDRIAAGRSLAETLA